NPVPLPPVCLPASILTNAASAVNDEPALELVLRAETLELLCKRSINDPLTPAPPPPSIESRGGKRALARGGRTAGASRLRAGALGLAWRPRPDGDRRATRPAAC